MVRSAGWLVVGMLLGMTLAVGGQGEAQSPPAPASTPATATAISLWSVRTAEPTNTPTSTPTPTPTPSTTPTHSPTPTPSETPTPTLTPFLIVMENGQYGPVVVTAPPGYILPTATETPFISFMPRSLPADLVVLPIAVEPTPIPAPTQTPAPTATPYTTLLQSPPSAPQSTCDCSADTINCAKPPGSAGEQACFDRCWALTGTDIHDLDRDGDMLACE